MRAHRLDVLAVYSRLDARRVHAFHDKSVSDAEYQRLERMAFCAWALYLASGGEPYRIPPEALAGV